MEPTTPATPQAPIIDVVPPPAEEVHEAPVAGQPQTEAKPTAITPAPAVPEVLASPTPKPAPAAKSPRGPIAIIGLIIALFVVLSALAVYAYSQSK